MICVNLPDYSTFHIHVYTLYSACVHAVLYCTVPYSNDWVTSFFSH